MPRYKATCDTFVDGILYTRDEQFVTNAPKSITWIELEDTSWVDEQLDEMKDDQKELFPEDKPRRRKKEQEVSPSDQDVI